MAVTFPRDFLEPLPFRAVSFDTLDLVAQAPTRGALQQVVELAPRLWKMRYETYPLREAEAEAWKAWIESLRAGARLFKAWNPVREYAIAYRAGYGALTRSGGGSFADGTAELAGISVSRAVITIETLPSDFVLSSGDMISIPFATASRSLHRVVEGAVASVGGEVTVSVEPILPLAVTIGALISLKRPHCLAVLDPASVSGPWQNGRRAPIVFSAVSTY